MVYLTPQQQRVLELAAAGFTLVETADHLELAPSTVHTHREKLYRRLGAVNMAQAVSLGYELGILGARSV